MYQYAMQPEMLALSTAAVFREKQDSALDRSALSG
jgi:hypothetical protein